MGDNVHDGHRQRFKEQFLQSGLDGFNSHQLLEMLLYYSIPRKDTNPLAHRLMDTFGSLSGVLEAEYEEVCRVEGVTPHTAMLLCFCGKLFWRYYQDKYEDGVILTGTQDFRQLSAAPVFRAEARGGHPALPGQSGQAPALLDRVRGQRQRH